MEDHIDNVTAPPRIPTCPESHRGSIAEFLEYFEARVEKALASYRELTRTSKDENTVRQLQYFVHQRATIRFLHAMNNARRKHVKVSRTRRAGVQS